MPPAVVAGLSALAPAVGSGLGQLFSNGDKEKQDQAMQAALAAISQVGLPSVEDQKVALAQLVSQGQLTPEALDTITQGDSNLSDISIDPRLKATQMKGLDSLEERADQGFTASDRADLNAARRQVERDQQARTASILQNMAARGMGGSGAELIAQLTSSQEGADRAGQESDRLAAMAQQNALQAATQAAQTAGSIRGQDYNEKAAAAQAQDAIDRFNAQNRQSVGQYNTSNRNEAQKYNLGEKQRISDSNTNLSNQEQIHNKQLLQQDFENKMKKAGAVAGVQSGQAAYNGQKAASTQGMWGDIGQGVGKAGLAVAGYMKPSTSSTAASSNRPSDDDWYKWSTSKAQGGVVESPLKIFKHFKKDENPVDINEEAQAEMDRVSNSIKEEMLRKQAEGKPGYARGGMVLPLEEENPGDDYENDVVHAKLSPGEVVLPNSILDSNDDAIMAFVKLAKQQRKRG